MFFRILSFIVVLAAVFHAVTYLLWLYESRRRGAAQPSKPLLPQLVAWAGDGAALLLVVLSWPIGLVGRPKTVPAVNGRPVVLLHGWSLNRASMALLAARLRRDGRDAYTVNYPSLLRDTDAKARHVAASLRRISAETGAERVDVLAHSLGGVLVRAAARYHGCEPLLGNVVTLGSPHQGTALAVLFAGMGLRQLRPGSRYLERLADGDDLPTRIHFTAIATSFDAIVFPLECCNYPAAMNVTLGDIGHHALLFSERVYALAKENLDVPPREATGERDADSA